MWTTIAQFTAAAVSVASLAFAIVTQTRQSSQRKYAERAETAMRLLSSLQEIDLGGISPKLDGSLALKLHNEQVHGLQELIRLNIAEFEARAKRRGLSLTLHFLIGIYGVLVIGVGLGGVRGVGRIQADQRWAGVLIVLAIVGVGVVMILDCAVALARRVHARTVRRRAGIYVPSALEIASSLYVSLIRWCQRRRESRGRTPSKN